MASKIEWLAGGDSWNPIRARNKATGGVGHFCVHVSPGCEACYAERMQPRFNNKIRYAAQDQAKVDVFLDEDVLTKPLHWKRPRLIFPCSMTDMFGEWVTDTMLDCMFGTIAATPCHTYLILTKRSGRMANYMAHNKRRQINWPLPNVWLGVSVEDQRRADERIPELLETPAAVRWLSVEPQLEHITVDRRLFDECSGGWLDHLDWIICGGESGPNARPFDLAWARSLRDQCKAAGVPYFLKQCGARPVLTTDEFDPKKPGTYPVTSIKDRKGGDMSEWPADLRVREYPQCDT